MSKHVTAVAILMIIQGLLELLMAGLYGVYVVFGAAMGAIPWVSSEVTVDEQWAFTGIFAILTVFMSIFSVLFGAAAIVKFVAAFHNLKYRKRTLGIIALASSAVALPNLYCLVTAVPLLVYGLVVYLDLQTKQAFELGEQGVPAGQIPGQIAAIAGQWPTR